MGPGQTEKYRIGRWTAQKPSPSRATRSTPDLVRSKVPTLKDADSPSTSRLSGRSVSDAQTPFPNPDCL